MGEIANPTFGGTSLVPGGRESAVGSTQSLARSSNGSWSTDDGRQAACGTLGRLWKGGAGSDRLIRRVD